METRPLGRTGFEATRIGLGMAALGRPGYINLGHGDDLNGDVDVNSMRRNAHDVLNAAFDVGIRYFDVARSYGKAEEFLGSWLRSRNLPFGTTTIGSKWGYTYVADWDVDADTHEVKEHSLHVLKRQWLESRKELGGQLNLYQIHSATLESGVLDNIDVMNHLANLKREGVAIGISLSGAEQAQTLRKAMAVTIDGVQLFETVQATWNILERSTGDALQDAHDSGMAVIIKEALANGRLTPKNDDPEADELMTVLRQQSERLKTTIDALSIAAVLNNRWADVVLSGAANVEHLQSNVCAVNVQFDDEADALLRQWIEVPQVYWGTRSELAWN